MTETVLTLAVATGWPPSEVERLTDGDVAMVADLLKAKHGGGK